MTTQQLAYKSLPSIAGVEGATSPNPGKVGVWAWSTSQAKPVFWNGSKWSAGAAGGTGGIEVVTANQGSILADATSIYFDSPQMTGTVSGSQAIISLPESRLLVGSDANAPDFITSLFFSGDLSAVKDVAGNMTITAPTRMLVGSDDYPPDFTNTVIFTGAGVVTNKDAGGNFTVTISGGSGTTETIEDYFSTSPKNTGKATPYGHFFRTIEYPSATQTDGYFAYLKPTADHDIDDLEEFTVVANCPLAGLIDICIGTRGAIVGNFHVVITRSFLAS